MCVKHQNWLLSECSKLLLFHNDHPEVWRGQLVDYYDVQTESETSTFIDTQKQIDTALNMLKNCCYYKSLNTSQTVSKPFWHRISAGSSTSTNMKGQRNSNVKRQREHSSTPKWRRRRRGWTSTNTTPQQSDNIECFKKKVFFFFANLYYGEMSVAITTREVFGG